MSNTWNYYSLKSDILDEVQKRISETEVTQDEEVLDYITDIVDSYTPIYNQDILDVV